MDTEVVLSLYNHYLLSNICVVEDENLRDEEDLDRTWWIYTWWNHDEVGRISTSN